MDELADALAASPSTSLFMIMQESIQLSSSLGEPEADPQTPYPSIVAVSRADLADIGSYFIARSQHQVEL
jgi:hypothetical protein